MQRVGNQRGGINAQPAGVRVSAISSRDVDQATEVITGTFTIHSIVDVPLKIGRVVFPSNLYVLDMEGLEVISRSGLISKI